MNGCRAHVRQPSSNGTINPNGNTMQKLEALFDHIAARVNVNLKPMGIDVRPLLKNAIPRERHLLYYAF